MDSITQNKRYLPHEISTKMNSVKLYRQTKDIGFVCRRYHISKASLMRWNKQYDGTKESLEPKSHKPLTPHPNSHTEEEIKWIKDYHCYIITFSEFSRCMPSREIKAINVIVDKAETANSLTVKD